MTLSRSLRYLIPLVALCAAVLVVALLLAGSGTPAAAGPKPPTAQDLVKRLQAYDELLAKRYKDAKKGTEIGSDAWEDLHLKKQKIVDEFFKDKAQDLIELRRWFELLDCADILMTQALARDEYGYPADTIEKAIRGARECLKAAKQDVKLANPVIGEENALQDMIDRLDKVADQVAAKKLKGDKLKDELRGNEKKNKVGVRDLKITFVNRFLNQKAYGVDFPEIFKALDRCDEYLIQAQFAELLNKPDVLKRGLYNAHASKYGIESKIASENNIEPPPPPPVFKEK
jgi:hypothetical protein